MSIVTVSATKPTPDSKVGISFAQDAEGGVNITSINEAGLFASSKLQVGHEILDINGTSVVGMRTPDVKALLSSIPEEIIIQAREIDSWKMTYQEERTRTERNDRVYVGTKYTLNCTRTEIPAILALKGVPRSKWERIYDSFSSDLMPAMYKSDQMDRTFKIEMSNYTNKQMTKGYVGFGQESHHERKVLNMVHQCAVLANNAALVSSNSLAQANALLNRHGIMAQLVLRTKPLPKYSTKQNEINEITKPCGLEFVLI